MTQKILGKLRSATHFNMVASLVVGVTVAIVGYNIITSQAATTYNADINGDGQVNVIDMSTVLGKWGTTGQQPADINKDNVVSVLDLSILLSQWGTVAPPPGSGLVHPGVLVNKAQLDFVKAKVAASAEPWKSELAKAMSAKAEGGVNAGIAYSSASYTPHPVQYIECGNAKQGCLEETNDSLAAYTNALLWYYTGDTRYAQQSIKIMNAWSGMLLDHRMSTTDPNLIGGVLNAAWAGAVFPRAAEIMRYTYTPAAGQTALNVPNMERMLREAFLPHVINGWVGGGHNWVTSMAEATIGIGVFLDDRTVFNNGIADWRGNTPANIYMQGDVNPWQQLSGMPIPIPGTKFDRSTMTAAQYRSEAWWGATSFVSGLEGETCRDMNHMAMGMSGLLSGAETARIQGVDLYGEQQARIIKGMELNTGYLNAHLANRTANPAGWVCPNAVNYIGGGERVTWQIGYNHYANRSGQSLPNTNTWITNTIKPSTYRINNVSAYEMLTHYQVP